jgi:dephospho-CoA kinase
MRRFLLVGLTGGIATGKSTVNAMLAGPSVRVVDADALARAVVEPGTPAHAQIVAEFGRDVLQPDGRLDRARLGELVFPDPVKRKRLEAITHPAIRARFEKIMADLDRAGFDGILIWDAALLVESGGTKKMDRVVVVTTDPATQLRRLMARDGCSEEAARTRTASQMPLAVKVRYADYVVDNSGSREQTEARVREVYRSLLADLHERQAPRR